MLSVLIAGALAGLGVLCLALLYDRGSATAAAELARIDAVRRRTSTEATLTDDRRHGDESLRTRRLGAQVSWLMEARGWSVPSGLRADLAVLGRSVETHLGMSVLAGLAGFLAPAVVGALLVVLWGVGPATPVWIGTAGAVAGAILPTVQLRGEAAERRRDFRHVVSSFLDLVSMNLAGGRGVPEALTAATSLSDGWAVVRLRDTIEAAKLHGVTPWAALGELGEEMAVDELRDLAAALALVAEDGAKVRESLTARAASMRQRELADAESRAAQRSQSMLVAQLLLCVGFLMFLIYPPLAELLG